MIGLLLSERPVGLVSRIVAPPRDLYAPLEESLSTRFVSNAAYCGLVYCFSVTTGLQQPRVCSSTGRLKSDTNEPSSVSRVSYSNSRLCVSEANRGE